MVAERSSIYEPAVKPDLRVVSIASQATADVFPGLRLAPQTPALSSESHRVWSDEVSDEGRYDSNGDIFS